MSLSFNDAAAPIAIVSWQVMRRNCGKSGELHCGAL